MRERLLVIYSLFILSVIFLSSSVFAGEPLFDLSKTDYFENAHFSFVQNIKKRSNPSGSHGRRFMPAEGEVLIDYRSNRNSSNYEMVTLSKKDDKLLYKTELVVDRFGITEKYAMYDNEGNSSYLYSYDVFKEEASIEYLDEESKVKRKKVSVDKEIYSLMTIPYIVGAVNFNENGRHVLKAVVGDGRFFEIYIQKVNDEKIIVGDRTFECKKIECGFTGIIGLFVPKMVFWVDEKTRIPVKQDMMGGAIIELEMVYD